MQRRKIVIFLTILILIFGIANLWKYDIINRLVLENNQKAISVLKDIITILSILFAAFFSYFRFFAGRSFSTRAEIEIDVKIIETDKKKLMHVVTVTVTNIGNLTIWKPSAKIGIRQFSSSDNNEENIVEEFFEKSYFGANKNTEVVIDAGEKEYFVLWHQYETSTWAVTYNAEVNSSNGKWMKTLTVANKVEDSN